MARSGAFMLATSRSAALILTARSPGESLFLTEQGALALKVVIQCAGRKHDWSYLRSNDGKRVEFVAHPGDAPPAQGIRYAHPDDLSDNGMKWRQRVLDYNIGRGTDLSSLEPAFRLYRARQYQDLVEEFGQTQIFVLSAGWGLVRSDFLLPHYDITFQRPENPSESYIWRRPHDRFEDFNQLTANSDDHVIFLGGENYRHYFQAFAGVTKARKTIYFKSSFVVRQPEFDYEYFATKRNRNWHYSCADELIELHRQGRGLKEK